MEITAFNLLFTEEAWGENPLYSAECATKAPRSREPCKELAPPLHSTAHAISMGDRNVYRSEEASNLP